MAVPRLRICPVQARIGIRMCSLCIHSDRVRASGGSPAFAPPPLLPASPPKSITPVGVMGHSGELKEKEFRMLFGSSTKSLGWFVLKPICKFSFDVE